MNQLDVFKAEKSALGTLSQDKENKSFKLVKKMQSEVKEVSMRVHHIERELLNQRHVLNEMNMHLSRMSQSTQRQPTTTANA